MGWREIRLPRGDKYPIETSGRRVSSDAPSF